MIWGRVNIPCVSILTVTYQCGFELRAKVFGALARRAHIIFPCGIIEEACWPMFTGFNFLKLCFWLATER